MTEIARYIAGDVGVTPDWMKWPWSTAQSALWIIEMAPRPTDDGGSLQPLDELDTRALAEALVRLLVVDGEWAWSSALLGEIVSASEKFEGKPPEAVLEAIDSALGSGLVSQNHYEFCRALNQQLLSKYGARAYSGLDWLADDPKSPAHACLRYWLLALRPTLCTKEVEDRLLEMLDGSGFLF